MMMIEGGLVERSPFRLVVKNTPNHVDGSSSFCTLLLMRNGYEYFRLRLVLVLPDSTLTVKVIVR